MIHEALRGQTWTPKRIHTQITALSYLSCHSRQARVVTSQLFQHSRGGLAGVVPLSGVNPSGLFAARSMIVSINLIRTV